MNYLDDQLVLGMKGTLSVVELKVLRQRLQAGQESKARRAELSRTQDVRHPLFQDNEFFDPCDLLQVKYEMLQQVHVDKRAVSRTAREFGFSRPSFYQVEFAFEQGGLPGLLPQKSGPRNGHKLTPEVMKFVGEALLPILIGKYAA